MDREGTRFKLNEICVSLGKRYIDVATEIHPATERQPIRYGGRVFVRWETQGCLACCDVLDMEEVSWDLASPEERANREHIYGVRTEGENGSGPSVVTLNGVVAAIATTEFMVAVTGLRAPARLTTYRGDKGVVTLSKDLPKPDCLICGMVPPVV